ncbi:Fe2+-enterobactin ABC transporter substrate-binding protein [Pantoea sp. Ap-967]|uniref:Fe2+-enterobactin ABC transporter substrate-binding protein n=1 Tax=Pantoea sp. Ap-967 TaxID=2608362 RepID=UPI00141ED2D0|nr:Fe2+-enterobactin ABC transporter substrate-binding protein [Pantoea sp. Ap-967]NIE77655.1 Fe2+-enterobactin ABC transporter substrate-binding protein [Pantoea sp. Ap-967]
MKPYRSCAALAAATVLLVAAQLVSAAPRIVSTTPSVTGILLAMDAPLVASAAAAPSRLTDDKGFFSQWAAVADQRDVQVLYRNLQFDIEAVVASAPDLLVVSATGADSAAPHLAELKAQGIDTVVVNYSNQSWQALATELGERTGLQQQAKAVIQRFDDYTQATAARLQPSPRPAVLVGYNIGGSYSIGRTISPQARLLTALGFQVRELPEAMAGQVIRATEFQFISRENLAAAIGDADVFLLSADAHDAQAFRDDPVLANLAAVRNQRVYPLGPSSFRIDYYSGRQMLDTVAGYFAKP